MKYQVYQIPMSSRLCDEINRLGSWELAHVKFPQVKAHTEVSVNGSRGYKPEFAQFYELVAEVEADTYDQVFDAMNGYPEPGVTVKALKRHVSMSVGHILVDGSGRAFICEHIGWKEVEFNKA